MILQTRISFPMNLRGQCDKDPKVELLQGVPGPEGVHAGLGAKDFVEADDS